MNENLIITKAKDIRANILTMTTMAGSGHIAGPLGIADIFAYLYFYEFEQYLGTSNTHQIASVPFILSCGHYAPVLYASLIEKGIIEKEEMTTFRRLGSNLQGHTRLNPNIGIFNTSGSLGQGLGIATGMAISMRNYPKNRIYVLISDGETNEGSIWEAAMLINKYQLSNITIILDRNNIQQSGNSNNIMPLEPLSDKWEAFGITPISINGNQLTDIHAGFNKIDRSKPHVIISYTTPGKGVKKIENDYHWHSKTLSEEDLADAIKNIYE